jgi:hypothetical protein
MQRRQNKRVSFKRADGPATGAESSDTHCVPGMVHTHARQPTQPIETFEAMLRREPTLADSSQGDRAYAMSDYCVQARRMMERVIVLLESIDTSVAAAPTAQLSHAEQTALRHRRAQWSEHLRGNFYDLAGPPPASGGSTARYSLAVQLWLLVAHANVILQLSDAVGDLFAFYPPRSAYLSRNRLLVDNAPVMQYPLRTVLLALEHLVASLDTLDRFSADYTTYAAALEHRVSELVCHTGTRDEYNAPEWCVPAGNGERVSEEFCIYAMCWLTTVYNYAEGWCACNVVQVYDRLARRARLEHIRLPAHEVANADWAPSARSMRRATTFLCEYAFGLKAGQYTSALRQFLLQFDLRPGDVDIYRVLFKTNNAHSRSVLQHEFRGASAVARAYLRKLHHDRPVYAYLVELLQWADGERAHTRSASLAHLGFTRQLVVFNTLHQYIEGKFHVPFRERFLIFHRAPDMITALERARALSYPVIVQQFARFSVFVPHKRAPHLDVADVLRWRAEARARRKQLPALLPAAAAPADDEPNVGQHVRVYDCTTALDAFAVWALWLLQLANGRVDNDTDMRDFLLGMFGWR